MSNLYPANIQLPQHKQDSSRAIFDSTFRDSYDSEGTNMKSEYNLSDKLSVDIEYSLLECPSMASSFSSLDSPIPTPSTLHSQESLDSPGWPEAITFPTQNSTQLPSNFRMANASSGGGMVLPYGHVEEQARVPLIGYAAGYPESVEQFWSASDVSKGYNHGNAYSSQPPMGRYPQVVQHCYRTQTAPCLPISVSNPCLSQPIFQGSERLPGSIPIDIPRWTLSTNILSPQTVTPSQAFPEAPMTPPSSFSGFPSSARTLRAHTPATTPIRSSSLAISGSGASFTGVLRGHSDNSDDEPLASPSSLTQRLQRQSSKKMSKKQSMKQHLKLENLPPIIKQVQFRCKEPGCKGRFKRQEHLKRHMKSHSKEKPHICWVPDCNRRFSRSDNLNAHYTKTHSKRGGRNRYVATLDETSPDYDPDFRGQLTPDGRPIYGSTLDGDVLRTENADTESWDG